MIYERIIGASNVFQSYDPDTFVVRRWLVDKIVTELHRENQNTVLITGEPGSGKTALVAYLAELWNSPRHFIRTNHTKGGFGISPRSFLISIATQLYEKYGNQLFSTQTTKTDVRVGFSSGTTTIVGRFVEELHTLPFLKNQNREIILNAGIVVGGSTIIGEKVAKLVDITEALDEYTLLHIALLDPLRKLNSIDKNETVILVIDALDEAVNHRGTSILDILPPSDEVLFPSNLKLVCTSRPGGHLTMFSRAYQLSLDDKANFLDCLEDALNYVKRRVSKITLPKETQISHTFLDKFIEILANKSDANFLYLYHYLNAVERNPALLTSDVSETHMPDGLDGIYRTFALDKLKASRTIEEWANYYKPVLGILAVAFEPLRMRQIAEFAGVALDYVEFVIQEIAQFLNEQVNDDNSCYRFYHTSFTEFLLDPARNRDFSLDSVGLHSKVVGFYAGGQTDASLLDCQSIDDGYAFRWLPHHFAGSKRNAELIRLLTRSSEWMQRSKKVTGSHSAYVGAVDRALEDFSDVLGSISELVELVALNAARKLVTVQTAKHNFNGVALIAYFDSLENALEQVMLLDNLKDRFASVTAIYELLNKRNNPHPELLVVAESILNQMDFDSFNKSYRASMEDRRLGLARAYHLSGSADKADRLFEHVIQFAEYSPTERTEMWWHRTERAKLTDLVYSLAMTGRFGAALDIVGRIEDKVLLVHMYSDIANAYDYHGDSSAAEEYFSKAEGILDAIDEIWDRTAGIGILSLRLRAAQRFERAKTLLTETLPDVLSEISSGDVWLISALDFAEYLALGGLTDEAQLLLDLLPDDGDLIEVGKYQVAKGLSVCGQFKQAQDLLNSIQDQDHMGWKLVGYVELVRELAKASHETLGAVVEICRKTAAEAHYGGRRAELLAHLAYTLAEIESPYAEAIYLDYLNAVNSIRNEYRWSEALLAVVRQMKLQGQFPQYFKETIDKAKSVMKSNNGLPTLGWIAEHPNPLEKEPGYITATKLLVLGRWGEAFKVWGKSDLLVVGQFRLEFHNQWWGETDEHASEIDKATFALTTWAGSLYNLEAGLYKKILLEALRIFGWERSDWREVYQFLNREHSH